MARDAASRAVERIARESYGRLVALLAGRTRDLAAAEDLLADAFAAAFAQWPAVGVPANPDGWLVTVAKRRHLDLLRRGQVRAEASAHLQLLAAEVEHAAAAPDALPDRRLALMFACAHPAIERSARSPLMLQAVLGFSAKAIAAAFLISPAAMSQRLVRAKAQIKADGVPFSTPEPAEMPARLDAVLEATYAAYSAGWDGAGDDASELAPEAIWLAGLITERLPDEPEAKALLALMLYADARRAARRDADGGYVPLDDQDVGLWDRALIARAERLLHAANGAGPTGRYQLEAAIQSAHVAQRLSGKACWPAIVALYDHLIALTGSPVAALNRAAALAETAGPQAGLAALAGLSGDKRMASYQPYWATLGCLRLRAGETAAGREALQVAVGLSTDAAVRRRLREELEAAASPV